MGSNLNNLYMHLTNYAINKDAENFQQASGKDDDSGHKRSLSSIFKHIDEAHAQDPEILTSKQVWAEIKDLTVKTCIACH